MRSGLGDLPQFESEHSLDEHYRDVYSAEASQYDLRRFASGAGSLSSMLEVRLVASYLSPLPGLKVLDVAAGTGRLSLWLTANGACVTSLDLSQPMLEQARRTWKETRVGNIGFCVGNGRRLPFADERFDAVTSTRFFHLLPRSQYPAFTSEMTRVVRRGGRIAVTVFNPLYGGGIGPMRDAFWRWVRHKPPENYLWPHRIGEAFQGLIIRRVAGCWLPGLGRITRNSSRTAHRVGAMVDSGPMRWLCSPLLIVAERP